MSNFLVILNRGLFSYVESKWAQTPYKWLVFEPDGSFYMKYATQEEAEDCVKRNNENGQAEQRLEVARREAFTLTPFADVCDENITTVAWTFAQNPYWADRENIIIIPPTGG